jgi:hypothetical protein
LENKNKKRTPLPLAGLNPAHARGRFPLPRPRFPPPQPTYRPTPRSRPRTLTRRPHSSVAFPSPSLVTASAGGLARPVSRSVILAAYGFVAVTSGHRPLPRPVPSPIPSPHRKGWHHPVLAAAAASLHGTARRVVSSSPLCGIYSGAVHLTSVRRAPPLPSPREPIKGPPRAHPCPAPASATYLPPRPSSVAKAPPSSSPPVSPPLLSLPLWWFIEKLDRLISFATPPGTWDTTPLPQSSHAPHQRRLPPQSSATSPRSAPSRPPLAKLSPPLSSLAPPHARAPAHYPRTGSPATNCRGAHRQPGSPPRTAGSPPPSTVGAVPPLLLSLTCGPRGDGVTLARPRRLPP